MSVTRGHAVTHTGRRRNNEDAYLVEPELGLYVVADGMGGYEGGEIAARLVVDGLHRFFSQVGPHGEAGMRRRGPNGRTVAEDMVRMAIRQASHEIRKIRRGKLRSMGATAAVLWVREGRALIAHVGDSRVYRLREGVLDRLTRDHSVYAELLEAGALASHAVAERNVITRAVGVPGAASPDIRIEKVEAGDVFVLCSDGLSDVVPREEMRSILTSVDLRRASETLVARAYMGGGTDNITAVVVETAA